MSTKNFIAKSTVAFIRGIISSFAVDSIAEFEGFS